MNGPLFILVLAALLIIVGGASWHRRGANAPFTPMVRNIILAVLLIIVVALAIPLIQRSVP